MNAKSQNIALQIFGLYWLESIDPLVRDTSSLRPRLASLGHAACAVQEVYGERLITLSRQVMPLRYVIAHPRFQAIDSQAFAFRLLSAGLQHCFKHRIDVHDAIVVLDDNPNRPAGILLSICCSSSLYVTCAAGSVPDSDVAVVEPLDLPLWFDTESWSGTRFVANMSEVDIERFFTCVFGQCAPREPVSA